MTTAPYSFRLMQPGEESQVSELVARVFNEFVAPDFPPEGIEEFLKYVHPDAIRQRARASASTVAILALVQDKLVGVIEIRDHHHISLFFVDRAHMGKGVGRDLWRRALATCRRDKPDLARVTVNSSPYAVPIYKRLGFRQTKPEQVVNGIRVVPMAVEL